MFEKKQPTRQKRITLDSTTGRDTGRLYLFQVKEERVGKKESR